MCTDSSPAARSTTSPPTRPAEARAQAIASPAALERLRAEWEALWAQVPDATPFQHPAWLLPWWRHIARGTLAATAVRSPAGELVALAPLYVYPDGERRQLFPLGIATSDDLTVLVRPGWEAQALCCIAAQLAARADFDAIACPQQRAGSLVLDLPCPPGWQQEIRACEPHPVLDLRAAQAMPKAMRDNVRHCRSRGERAGTVTCETAGAQHIEEFLAALERLHAQRWAGRGESGVLQDARVRAMHREAAPQLQAAGLLRLQALRVDGRIVAVLYCLAHGRRWQYYLGGFDPAQAAISPGTLLVAHAIAQARAEGATAFDFLRGQEAYKYRWGAVDEARFALRRWRS
ncbi:GNAT family N-acetyltransferase [Ramlibacter alkalitolerans]|uniref:GNAT family N-acetyltransferase n=1 Tax=Ramlibacter alkalitolerans TaxID=2039631 RepID=A0ABS1JV82_9BURK|nr:GNAT family N-acetyltransferase [Ramlibacter alkalitolerans]MBL0428200.1 GNAT family N-acetyltransferase [Ramlibacter alkalitolerans]